MGRARSEMPDRKDVGAGCLGNVRLRPFSDVARCPLHVCFSNRPFGVKRFPELSIATMSMSLAGSCFSSGSAPGPFHYWVSRTRAEQSFGRPCVLQTAGPSRHTNSPHPSSREGHHSTARWAPKCLHHHRLTLHSSHAVAAVCSRSPLELRAVNQMRCRITANRRAKATTAFFIPRCTAIFMAHALSHDHFATRTSMI